MIARSQRLQRNLDLRLFVNTCTDRLQWANGAAETHWLELLESRMSQHVLGPGTGYESPAERKSRELALLDRIARLPPKQRMEVWKKETGRSQAGLYRRLSERKSNTA
jgi:hypothetical protein